MTNPNVKKGFSAIMIIPTLIMIFVLFAATRINNNHHKPYSTLKAVFKEPFRPLPYYGSNSINTRGPAWSDDAFRDSAASMKLQIVRYPGGGFGDFWDWRKGWFIDSTEAESKGLTIPASFRAMKYSPTGLKELKLLVDQTNCEVLFEVNMVSRDLDDQIEMLKSAQAMGFHIRWVELGNEFNLPKAIGRTKYTTSRDYGIACNKWAQAIKDNFPGVEVGAIGGNMPYAPDVANWNKTVINEAPNVDAIVAHVYPVPAQAVDEDGLNFKNIYNSFKNNFDRMGFDDVNGRKIWFTEYNVHWDMVKPGDEGKAVQQRAFSWGQVLSTILMTSAATDVPGNPEVIINSSIANWRGFAAIEKKRDGQVYMLPNGRGLRAWCEACHNANSCRQISFMSGGSTLEDYEVLGWHFKGTGGTEKDLLVNFTSDPVTINIAALNNATKIHYYVSHANKEKIIINWDDITHETKEIQNNEIEIPPYGIATF